MITGAAFIKIDASLMPNLNSVVVCAVYFFIMQVVKLLYVTDAPLQHYWNSELVPFPFAPFLLQTETFRFVI